MPRGKSFICWIGNSVALYIGDECEFQPENSDEWLKGKIGCKRNGAYVFRVGRKEYPVWMRTQLRLKGEWNVRTPNTIYK